MAIRVKWADATEAPHPLITIPRARHGSVGRRPHRKRRRRCRVGYRIGKRAVLLGVLGAPLLLGLILVAIPTLLIEGA
jgi:hypothetical protein